MLELSHKKIMLEKIMMKTNENYENAAEDDYDDDHNYEDENDVEDNYDKWAVPWLPEGGVAGLRNHRLQQTDHLFYKNSWKTLYYR